MSVNWDDYKSVVAAFGTVSQWDDQPDPLAADPDRLPEEPLWHWIKRLADIGRGNYQMARYIQKLLREAATEVANLQQRVGLLEQMDAIGEECICNEAEGLWEINHHGHTRERYYELNDQYRTISPPHLEPTRQHEKDQK